MSTNKDAGDFDAEIEQYTQQMTDINTRLDMMSQSQSEKDAQFEQLQSELQQLNNDKIKLEGEMRFTDAEIECINENICSVQYNINNTKIDADIENNDII